MHLAKGRRAAYRRNVVATEFSLERHPRLETLEGKREKVLRAEP